jgi:predicted transposase YbfD/YdcC
MGCQKNIAHAIRDKQADYVLMVKGNQKGLKEQIEKVFSIAPIKDEYQSRDLGHGRIELRKCEVVDQLRFLDDRDDWQDLKSIARVSSRRINKQSGKESVETRYYITSLKPDAQIISQSVRGHWAVENNLHWSLDVIFKEDASLKKKDHSALNYNIITKMALNLIDMERSTKKSKPSKRLLSALDNKYREKILKI